MLKSLGCDSESNGDFIVDVIFLKCAGQGVIFKILGEKVWYCRWQNIIYVGKVGYRDALRELGAPCVLSGIDSFMFSREEGYCCAFGGKNERVVVYEYDWDLVWKVDRIVSLVTEHSAEFTRLLNLDVAGMKHCLLGGGLNKEQEEKILTEIFYGGTLERVSFFSVFERVESRILKGEVLVVTSALLLVCGSWWHETLRKISEGYARGAAVVRNDLVGLSNKLASNELCVLGVFKKSDGLAFSVGVGVRGLFGMTERSFGDFPGGCVAALCFAPGVNCSLVIDALANFCGCTHEQAALIDGVSALRLLMANVSLAAGDVGNYSSRALCRLFSMGDSITIDDVLFEWRYAGLDTVELKFEGETVNLRWAAIKKVSEYEGKNSLLEKNTGKCVIWVGGKWLKCIGVT